MTSRYPPGSNAERVRRVLEHYEQQSEDEAVAEDEAAPELRDETFFQVPSELVPKVRRMVADYRSKSVAR
jgi:hypothetical protein